MSGAILRPNEGVQERTRQNVIRYYEIIEGKTALLQTWEERCPDDYEYIMSLKVKIRKARILLSHIKY